MAQVKAATAEASWEALRDEAVGDIDSLIAEVTEARKDLRAYRSTLEQNRLHLSRGGRVFETPALFDIRTVRTTLTERLDRLDRARNAARESLWRLQVSEGTTLAEIARVWGFSRQLVSRALGGGRRHP